MRIAFFGTKSYEQTAFDQANARFRHQIRYLEPRLNRDTARLTDPADAVCVFVNDQVDADTIAALRLAPPRVIALRCAGYNNVDLTAATQAGMPVVRVPAYSPHAVAEHTLALILALNRRIHKAYNRVREGNFALEGLCGFDLHGKTAGVIGTGKIGAITAAILVGFGCRVLAHDVAPNPACLALGIEYTSRDVLLQAADIITLHCPLLPSTHHLIDPAALGRMKPGAMLINTSRGALIDTSAVIAALKSGHLGWLGIDVYEEEEGIFFEDLSAVGIRDDMLARLMTFPNVLVTGHQAFLTREALDNIANTTLGNLRQLEAGLLCSNLVVAEPSTTSRS
jgi:D-lactate dehydrogenase